MSSLLTSKDHHWFRLANAGSYCDKQSFYAFKTRFLKRFAQRDGWDLQEMPKFCYACAGSGTHLTGQSCHRCHGSGIYTIAHHWLERWQLGDHIYHVPIHCSPPFKEQHPVHTFSGRIQHEEVPGNVAYRCYLRLLLRHEPQAFYDHILQRIKDKWVFGRLSLKWKLLRLREKLDLFPTVEKQDDVPF